MTDPLSHTESEHLFVNIVLFIKAFLSWFSERENSQLWLPAKYLRLKLGGV